MQEKSMAIDIHRFANPTRFLRIAAVLQPWVAAVFFASLTVGLYMSFFTAPADYQQGESSRIMYVHVPAAWMGMFCYTTIAIASAVSLIWKHPLADVIGRATAPVGAAFTFLTLATGSLWGKPMWGTWWVWDARLTSMLVLLFLYIGYMALQGAFDDRVRAAKASAILALVGFVNVPIIKFSVDWWNTLHQPASVLKMGGSSIHPSMLWPLLIMAIAFKAYYVWVLLVSVRREIIANKVRILRLKQVHGG